MKFLSKKVVLAIHNEQISQHGGLSGIRDDGLLDSAMNRPINLHLYENASIIVCAAAYAFGLIRNHPFQDGNKRTGFISAITFLILNGVDIKIEEQEVVLFISDLASGNQSELEVIDWLHKHIN
jgi:death on curing protein